MEKKIIMFILLTHMMIHAVDGGLDPSFGNGGLVITSFGGNNDNIAGVLVQPDGKIVAVGRENSSGTNNFALARYNPDGSLDNSFGTGGLVITDFGGADQAFDVLLQQNGKIIAIGISNGSGTNDFALARYNPDGSLDNSFGTGGLVTTDFGGDDQAFSAVLQSDGKIVVVGKSNTQGDNDFALARYNPDGSLDDSFGTGGLVTTNFGGDDQANAVALQSDGKIVVAGYSNAGGTNDFALARYRSDGLLDNSFGDGGLVTTNLGSAVEEIRAVLIQPDGKIVAVGFVLGFDFALARYNKNGTLDASFGESGIVIEGFGGNDLAQAATLESDGKIIAVGFSNAFGAFVIARFGTNGIIDPTLGGEGFVIANFGGDDQAQAAVMQPDGKLIAAGISDAGGTNDFALARFVLPSVEISSFARNLRAKYALLQ